jgi:hypothetical protein
VLILHHDLFLDFRKEKEFRIRPHSDTQLGHPDVDVPLVKQMIKEMADDPLAVSVGAGDIIDSDRPSTRLKKLVAFVGRDGELSQDDMKKMAWIDKEVYPMWLKLANAKNIKRGFGLLGEIDGHHHELYRSGLTSTQYLMRKLRDQLSDVNPKASPTCRYMGEMMCYILLHVYDISGGKKKGNQNFTIVIHLQHGNGGSQFISNDIPHLERKTSSYFEADIFLRGHSTKKWAAIRPQLYPSRSRSNPQLQEKTIVMVNTGGYLRGYNNDARANYVEHKNLAPVTLGHVVIHVKIRRDKTRNGNAYPEFKVEF